MQSGQNQTLPKLNGFVYHNLSNFPPQMHFATKKTEFSTNEFDLQCTPLPVTHPLTIPAMELIWEWVSKLRGEGNLRSQSEFIQGLLMLRSNNEISGGLRIAGETDQTQRFSNCGSRPQHWSRRWVSRGSPPQYFTLGTEREALRVGRGPKKVGNLRRNSCRKHSNNALNTSISQLISLSLCLPPPAGSSC